MSLEQIKRLVSGPITPLMISYIAQKAATVIPCDPPSSPNGLLLSFNSSNHNQNRHNQENVTAIPPLHTFIHILVTSSNVSTGTFLSTLVYLDRLKLKLPKLARGMHCTCHRVFLATLIVACKYLNDTSPRNKHWARYSKFFSIHKINLMERQLLTLLDFDLRITEAELVKHLAILCTGDCRPQVVPNLVLPSQPSLRQNYNTLNRVNATPLRQITTPQHNRCHHHRHRRQRSLPHSLSTPPYSYPPRPRQSLPLSAQLPPTNHSLLQPPPPPPHPISITTSSPAFYISHPNSLIRDEDPDLSLSDEELFGAEEMDYDDELEFDFSDSEPQYMRRRGSVQSNGSSSAESNFVATPRDVISQSAPSVSMANNSQPALNQTNGFKYLVGSTMTTATAAAATLANCNSYGKSFFQPLQDNNNNNGVRNQYLSLPPLTMVPTTGGQQQLQLQQQYAGYGSSVV